MPDFIEGLRNIKKHFLPRSCHQEIYICHMLLILFDYFQQDIQKFCRKSFFLLAQIGSNDTSL